MTERISKSFRAKISNIEELQPLRKMFGDAKFREVIAGMGEQVAQKIREQRNPVSGEFALVSSYPVAEDALRIEIDATSQMHEFLSSRLPELGFHFTPLGQTVEEADMADKVPVVYFAHAARDRLLAERIAKALVANGIQTLFDEWEIRGDSLPQKLSEGLAGCTDFVVLLTKDSIERPWVKLEIDAGLVRMLGGESHFRGVLHGISWNELPPFLKTLWHRDITDESFDDDVSKLVADIRGVSVRPPLGPSPAYAKASIPDVSPAASAIAKFFVEGSQRAVDLDPQTSIEKLQPALGLDEDDLIDALDELKGLGCVRDQPQFGARRTWTTGPHKRLFTRFDRYWKEWDPAKDAILVAQHVHQANSINTGKVAEALGWPPRRMNPAVTYLLDRELVLVSREISSQFVASSMRATDETRRFLKQRAEAKGGE